GVPRASTPWHVTQLRSFQSFSSSGAATSERNVPDGAGARSRRLRDESAPTPNATSEPTTRPTAISASERPERESNATPVATGLTAAAAAVAAALRVAAVLVSGLGVRAAPAAAPAFAGAASARAAAARGRLLERRRVDLEALHLGGVEVVDRRARAEGQAHRVDDDVHPRVL